MSGPATLHATCASLAHGGGAPAGVLLLGPSGSGKSDLALRLIERGWRLVADDRVGLEIADGRVRASCPETLSALLEVRGLGVMRLPDALIERTPVTVVLAVRLVPAAEVPRMAEPERWTLTAGHASADVPELRLWPFESSAPEKVRLAVLCALGAIVAPW